MFWGRRKAEQLADARAEALHWYERLGGQLTNLAGGDNPAVKQALVDAGERYTAAGASLDRADSVRQFELARETALEGLAYIRAARTAMGIDPGPDLPPLASARGTGAIQQNRAIDVEGRQFRASPNPGGDTPYYYPGGRVQGRPVPSGWYSEPWWKGALATGAGVFGGLLLFDAISGAFAQDSGGSEDAYAQGYDQGHESGYDEGYDQGEDAGYDQGYDTGYDSGFDSGGDFGGGDF
ncbi:MAG TPA: hypothetical protein VJY85_11260 [Candidatus Limnocylindria bacterium]|nr:hypothetical protein [Candidatus Limnocylindria bacterium]